MVNPGRSLRVIIIIVVLLTNTNSLWSQSRIDSLKIQARIETDYSKLGDLYFDTADHYYYGNQDSAILYSHLYLDVSLKAKDTINITYGYYLLADLYYYSRLDSSLYYAEKYMAGSHVLNDTLWIADGYSFLGYIFDQKGNSKLALEYFQKALECYKILDIPYELASCYNNLGYIVSYGPDQPTGLGYFLKSLEIAESIQDTGLIADASCNIAYFYDRVDDLNTAYKYYERALNLAAADYKKIPVEFEQAAPALVLADKNMVKTILRNLIHNSIKYSHQKSKIKISITQSNDLYITTIEDHVTGISKEDISRLFAMKSKLENPEQVLKVDQAWD